MIPIGSVVSMAVLFRAVKQHKAQAVATQRRDAASAMQGELNVAREQASRGSNLERMRQQTRTQMALGMGVSPMMMGGGVGAADPTMAAYITQAAQRQMGLGMV